VRYRCVHPLDGPCPERVATSRWRPRRNDVSVAARARGEGESPIRTGRRHEGHLGHEVLVVVDRVVRPMLGEKTVEICGGLERSGQPQDRR
jgi:hypothetical protein